MLIEHNLSDTQFMHEVKTEFGRKLDFINSVLNMLFVRSIKTKKARKYILFSNRYWKCPSKRNFETVVCLYECGKCLFRASVLDSNGNKEIFMAP
jgi:hypothetical protein